MVNTDTMSEKQRQLYNKIKRGRRRVKPNLVGELTEAEKRKDREPTEEEEANATERASFHGMAKVVDVACKFAASRYSFENDIDNPSHEAYRDPLTRGTNEPKVGKTTGLDLC